MTKERTRFDALAEELFAQDETLAPVEERKPVELTEKNIRKAAKASGFSIPPDAPIQFTYPQPPPSIQARSVRTAQSPKPTAYISALGQMYPVMTWSVESTGKEIDEGVGGFFYQTGRRGDYEVKFKISGIFMRDQLGDEVMLVICKTDGTDPHYYKLSVFDVKMTMTGRDRGSYTEIRAGAVQVI